MRRRWEVRDGSLSCADERFVWKRAIDSGGCVDPSASLGMTFGRRIGVVERRVS